MYLQNNLIEIYFYFSICRSLKTAQHAANKEGEFSVRTAPLAEHRIDTGTIHPCARSINPTEHATMGQTAMEAAAAAITASPQTKSTSCTDLDGSSHVP
jgi:hypothetical protein